MVEQYQLVKEAREVIFQFCETFSNEDYIKPIENFGSGSIRNTHAHIIDAYIHWIANFSLNKSVPYLKAETIHAVEGMRQEYRNVDEWIDEFLNIHTNQPNRKIVNQLGRRGEIESTPLTLFTHMITHEFHHKGQMVSMARMLGYPPPDTDIIRL